MVLFYLFSSNDLLFRTNYVWFYFVVYSTILLCGINRHFPVFLCSSYQLPKNKVPETRAKKHISCGGELIIFRHFGDPKERDRSFNYG